MTSTEQSRRVPQLRFPKFVDEWNIDKFKNFTQINQGLQIPISERYTEQIEGSFFYITNEFLKMNSDKKYFILNPPKSVICNEDDILMTRTGNTGQVVINVSGAFHNNFFKIKYDSEKNNKDFLVYFLRLYKTQKNILRLAGTSTIPDLNHSDFYRIEMPHPELPEQTKIANFLTAVDKRINLLQKKKAELTQYKKGVMQKIFPSAGSGQAPEIRFKIPNKDGELVEPPDWEEKKLGEIGSIVTGKTPKTSNKELWGGDIQFITPTDLVDDIKFQIGTARTVTNNDKLKILPEHSIVYTCIASIGKMAITTKPSITNQQINSLILNKEYNYEFIYYALLKITPKIKTTQANTTLPIINKTEFSKFKIDIPVPQEQQKIANFLSSIDKSIEKLENQIEQSQEWKRGLLQKMFV